MADVLEAMVIMLVVFWTTVIVGGWAVVRRVRKSRSTKMVTMRTRGRPDAVERKLLGLTARMHPGRTGEIATLRLSLRDAVDSTGRALEAAQQSDQPVGYLPAIGADLARASVPLERQLALAQQEPDPGIQQEQVRILRPQVEQVVTAAATVRRALVAAAHSVTSRDVDEVTGELNREVSAMSSWHTTYSKLG